MPPPKILLPFTTVLLLTILAASFLAHNMHGELDQEVATQVGHAPRHWWAGELLRLITSIPFTSDRMHLAVALVMTALCVGSCERWRGTFATIGIFLASHGLTLGVLAAALYVGHALAPTHSSRQLLDISDVGPSAGYYGCLGASLLASKRRSLLLSSCAVIGYLAVRVVLAWTSPAFQPHIFQTDLAHLIAFGIGGLILRYGKDFLSSNFLSDRRSDKKLSDKK